MHFTPGPLFVIFILGSITLSILAVTIPLLLLARKIDKNKGKGNYLRYLLITLLALFALFAYYDIYYYGGELVAFLLLWPFYLIDLIDRILIIFGFS